MVFGAFVLIAFPLRIISLFMQTRCSRLSLLLPHAVPCLSVLDKLPRARIIYIGIGAEQYV